MDRGAGTAVRPLPESGRKALAIQALAGSETVSAFAGLLDDKLADIARHHAVPGPLVREACLLHRLPTTSPAYWQGRSGLRARTGARFHALSDAVRRAMAGTPRSSSPVENLNARL